MRAKVVIAPFARNETSGMQFPAQRKWASVDEIVAVEIDGQRISVLLDAPPTKDWQGRVEIVGSEVGFWYGRHYTHLATVV